MDLQSAVDLGREAVLMVLVMAGPVLAVGLVVGLMIALFQAVTQMHEQTLVFVPKILAMALAAIVFTPWVARRMVEYSMLLFGGIR